MKAKLVNESINKIEDLSNEELCKLTNDNNIYSLEEIKSEVVNRLNIEEDEKELQLLWKYFNQLT